MRLGRKSTPGHYSPSRDYTIKIIWTQSVLFKSVGCSGAWPYLICLPLQALLSPALYWIALTTNIFNWNRSESSEVYHFHCNSFNLWSQTCLLSHSSWQPKDVIQCNVVTWPCPQLSVNNGTIWAMSGYQLCRSCCSAHWECKCQILISAHFWIITGQAPKLPPSGRL